MKGLVAYTGDSGNESESTHDPTAKTMKPRPFSDNRCAAQVVIRRPPTNHRNHTRAHNLGGRQQEASNDDDDEDSRPEGDASSMDISPDSSTDGEQDELTRLRALLLPPPISGLRDWGIPLPSTEPVDPDIARKLAQFTHLKRDATHPKHFNDSLMSNRSFRNPHLYANLVDWAGLVDEKTTNFPKSIWDPHDLQDDWFADNITEAQRKRADKVAAAQGGKRSHIDFSASAASSNASSGPGRGRFQPYNALGVNANVNGVASSAKDRERKPTRWG